MNPHPGRLLANGPRLAIPDPNGCTQIFWQLDNQAVRIERVSDMNRNAVVLSAATSANQRIGAADLDLAALLFLVEILGPSLQALFPSVFKWTGHAPSSPRGDRLDAWRSRFGPTRNGYVAPQTLGRASASTRIGPNDDRREACRRVLAGEPSLDTTAWRRILAARYCRRRSFREFYWNRKLVRRRRVRAEGAMQRAPCAVVVEAHPARRLETAALADEEGEGCGFAHRGSTPACG